MYACLLNNFINKRLYDFKYRTTNFNQEWIPHLFIYESAQPPTYPLCLSTLLVHAAYPRCVSTLLIHSVYPLCLSTLLIHSAYPLCLSTLVILTALVNRGRYNKNHPTSTQHHIPFIRKLHVC